MNAPQWTPSARELADLELVSIGALRCPDGFEIVVSETAVGDATELELVDPEGLPLARLHLDSWRGAEAGRARVAGRVEPLARNEFGPFRRLHLPPTEVRDKHPGAFAVPVSRVMTTDDVAAINRHAEQTGATPLLLVLTGPGSPRELSAPGLVNATMAAQLLIPGAEVVAVSAAARDDTEASGAFYTEVAAAYADDVLTVAGTGEPSELVARVRDRDRPPRDRRGLVVFFTGLSGSGKSTLARALFDTIVESGERTVTSLDGDVVRHHLSKGLGFSREDRETNIARIGWVAAEI
ncbi:MAG: adenylyl-sulfate kinase, partial [Nocardioidaceae bacterium]|nr:adenylyl-sulfate kinase [Nocardioidaceae bacterium]